MCKHDYLVFLLIIFQLLRGQAELKFTKIKSTVPSRSKYWAFIMYDTEWIYHDVNHKLVVKHKDVSNANFGLAPGLPKAWYLIFYSHNFASVCLKEGLQNCVFFKLHKTLISLWYQGWTKPTQISVISNRMWAETQTPSPGSSANPENKIPCAVSPLSHLLSIPVAAWWLRIRVMCNLRHMVWLRISSLWTQTLNGGTSHQCSVEAVGQPPTEGAASFV